MKLTFLGRSSSETRMDANQIQVADAVATFRELLDTSKTGASRRSSPLTEAQAIELAPSVKKLIQNIAPFKEVNSLSRPPVQFTSSNPTAVSTAIQAATALKDATKVGWWQGGHKTSKLDELLDAIVEAGKERLLELQMQPELNSLSTLSNVTSQDIALQFQMILDVTRHPDSPEGATMSETEGKLLRQGIDTLFQKVTRIEHNRWRLSIPSENPEEIQTLIESCEAMLRDVSVSKREQKQESKSKSVPRRDVVEEYLQDVLEAAQKRASELRRAPLLTQALHSDTFAG